MWRSGVVFVVVTHSVDAVWIGGMLYVDTPGVQEIESPGWLL